MIAAAAILKNLKIVILQGLEVATVSCKSNALTTRLLSHKCHTSVYLFILSCMTMQYIIH